MIGQTLSHFEITAKLGEGGMGEVYRAEDTKLGREVAIKVLPEAVAGDSERLARFEREAKVLASLNHPNIAGIHQVEEDDGVHFLVMELAHGKDLAERTTSGPLSIDEALGVAQQIALALEAAHEKGIVHRDLKPANVMVTPDGQVKVLDFGLAKALETGAGVGGQADLSLSPTLTAQMTQAGVILGTAAYMSPEQARGEEVDKRSDIWAFGVLLYELLTGQKPYSGKTLTDVIAAVVTKDPDWDALPSMTPSQIRRLLARCAQKESHERLHDIADARIAIQEAIDHPEIHDQETPQARTNWLGIAAGTIAGLILGALLWSRLAPAPTRPVTGRPTRLAIEIPADQELVHAEISRDGRMVAYVARPRRVGESSEGTTRLYLRPLDANQARVVPDTDRVDWAIFSPDGRWLAYYARDPQGFLGKLKKIAVEGGPAVTLLSDTGQAWGAIASWREDDRLLMDHVGSLVMLSADGGEPETIVPGEAFPREVILGTLSVPGTNEVLLTVGYQDEGSLRMRGEVVSLATGERRLLRDNFGPVFLRDGILIAATLEGFVVAPFDVERLEVEGSAVPLFSFDYSVSLSDNGTLLMYWGGFETRLPVVVDREGEVTDLPGLGSVFNGGAAVRHIRWSPDGKRLAMTVHDSELRSQIFTYDVPSGALTRLNFPGYYADEVAWSPDGESIAFTATSGESGYNLFVRSATGSDTPELLIEASSHDEPADWSPDGSTILFNRHHEEKGSDVFALDLTSGDASPLLATPAWEHSPRFSPDGKWVALVSDEAGQHEVYVVRYTGAGGEGNPRKFRASANGGDHPKWAPEGNTLYFVTPNQALTAVTVDESDDGEQLRFGAARDIFTLANMSMASNGPHAYDPHPDGARFALISIQEPEDASKNLQVVLNWFAELEQKLEPAN